MSQNSKEPTNQLLQERELHLSKLYSGKLLLRREIHLHETDFAHLLTLSYFTSIPSIIQKKFTYECQRCSNQKPSLFGVIPCMQCGKEHAYCRKCIEMGRVMECEPLYYWSGEHLEWPNHENPCTWEGKLTNAQQEASNRIVQAINSAEKELLIWGVCGSGKTEMLFQGISKALQLGKRVCIATPRADVVRELLPRFQSSFSEIHMQGLYGGSRDNDGTAQLTIATTHQLLRYSKAFDVLIIDEIDAFPFHKDPSLPFAAARAKKKISTTIYLTATPRKEQHLRVMRQKLPHMFVPVRFHGYPLPIPRFIMCFSLKKDLMNHMPPKAFITWLDNRENDTRQLLIFVPTITLAENMIKGLAQLLIKKKVIQTTDALQSVHADDTDRESKIDLFRKKDILVLVTTTILERGVTFPAIDVVILDSGHIVFDEAALVQIAGRAGRSPADPDGEVLFFHEGKTDAMVRAVKSIDSMNKRGGF